LIANSGFSDECDFILEGGRHGVELLPQGHRHRILHLGATHLQHVDKLVALDAQGFHQQLDLLNHEVVIGNDGDLECRGV